MHCEWLPGKRVPLRDTPLAGRVRMVSRVLIALMALGVYGAEGVDVGAGITAVQMTGKDGEPCSTTGSRGFPPRMCDAGLFCDESDDTPHHAADIPSRGVCRADPEYEGSRY